MTETRFWLSSGSTSWRSVQLALTCHIFALWLIVADALHCPTSTPVLLYAALRMALAAGGYQLLYWQGMAHFRIFFAAALCATSICGQTKTSKFWWASFDVCVAQADHNMGVIHFLVDLNFHMNISDKKNKKYGNNKYICEADVADVSVKRILVVF